MTPIAKPQRHKGTKKFGNEGSDPSLPNFFVPLCLCGFAIISILLTSTVSNAQDRAFLTQYCIGCHNEKAKTAGVMLDKMDIEHVGESAETWEKVVRKLRTGMMPPSGARRPDRSAIDAFTSNLETALDRAASAMPNPGTTALHRLNRTEYANAIRDLLALPVDSTTLLPGDDSADGFDNVADILGVSPLLIQGYVSAAAKVSRLAVGDPETSPEKITFRIPRGLSQVDHIEGLPLGTRGGMLIRHNFPLDGEYDFRVVRAGPGLGQTQVGGDEEIEISVNGERAFLIGRDAPRDIRLQMKAGPQSIGIAIIRKKNARGVDDLYDVLNGSAGLWHTCSSIRGSCIASNMNPPIWRPVRSIDSLISKSHRASRFSSGAVSPTTNFWTWRAGENSQTLQCSNGRCGACWRIHVPRRWWTTLPDSGCSCET